MFRSSKKTKQLYPSDNFNKNAPADTNLVQVVVVGSKESGKTSLIERFIDDTFTPYKKLSFGFPRKKAIPVDNDKILFKILDDEYTLKEWNSKAQRIIASNSSYWRSHVYLITVDLTNPDSLEEAKQFYNQIKKHTNNKDIIFIATKNDLKEEHKFTENDVKKLGKTVNVPVFLVSAETGENNQIPFIEAARLQIKRKVEEKKVSSILSDKKRKALEKEWDKGKNLKDQVLSLLEDYTKHYSKTKRFLTGHWNRTYIEEVNSICVQMHKMNKSPEDALRELKTINIPIEKRRTLAEIIEFLDEKIDLSKKHSTFKY